MVHQANELVRYLRFLRGGVAMKLSRVTYLPERMGGWLVKPSETVGGSSITQQISHQQLAVAGKMASLSSTPQRLPKHTPKYQRVRTTGPQKPTLRNIQHDSASP